MNNICFVLSVLGFLQMSSSLAMSLFGDDPVKINFCCPDGKMMRLRIDRDQLTGGFINKAECVRRRDVKNTLEGMEVSVIDLTKESDGNKTEFLKRKLSKLDNKMPKCGRGLEISQLNFNQTNANGTNRYQPYDSIELKNFNESVPDASEGNVYIDGKPVCDDGWDKKAARVACRMLGFADGEPTLGSRYGNVEDDMAMDDISCSGRESSLYDCDYSSSDNCDGNEGAGVVCTDIDGSNTIDLSGKLLRPGEEVATEDYCLADTWETVGGAVRIDLENFDGTVALSCDQCMDEVVCYYVRELYKSLTRRSGTISMNDRNYIYYENNIVRVSDKNGDDEVDFEEFKSKFVEYLTIVFNILDRDNDGSIDEVLTNESVKEYSLELFEKLLKNVVEFFDNNGDESISTEDFLLRYSDRNEDGKVTISELIGMSLINLPAPIYTAYTLLDEDQDEKLTTEEMLGFLRRTFTILDKNGDCYINLEEIIAALDESNLPEDFQLAVKLIGQQYLTLAKYFVNGFIAKADTDEDAKVTLEEIIKFSDFAFIESSIPVALSMGYPNTPIVAYLSGTRYRGYGSAPGQRRDAQDRAVVVWLTTLNTFINSPAYSAPAPAAQCGVVDQ